MFIIRIVSISFVNLGSSYDIFGHALFEKYCKYSIRNLRTKYDIFGYGFYGRNYKYDIWELEK